MRRVKIPFYQIFFRVLSFALVLACHFLSILIISFGSISGFQSTSLSPFTLKFQIYVGSFARCKVVLCNGSL